MVVLVVDKDLLLQVEKLQAQGLPMKDLVVVHLFYLRLMVLVEEEVQVLQEEIELVAHLVTVVMD